MNPIEPELMTIGTLAKMAGVGIETIRFYQRKGLLRTPDRSTGFRKYGGSDLRKIKFIKRVQGLGFSLKDASKLLEISECSHETRPLLESVCSEKIEQINQKMVDLNQMLEGLRQFQGACASGSSGDTHCSLLACFENDWKCCENSKGDLDE